MYDNSMDGVINKLLQVSSPSGLAFVADMNNGRIHRKMVLSLLSSIFQSIIILINRIIWFVSYQVPWH